MNIYRRVKNLWLLSALNEEMIRSFENKGFRVNTQPIVIDELKPVGMATVVGDNPLSVFEGENDNPS